MINVQTYHCKKKIQDNEKTMLRGYKYTFINKQLH